MTSEKPAPAPAAPAAPAARATPPPRLGATIVAEGVTFGVWAPHAEAVSVVGPFNEWKSGIDNLTRDGQGQWFGTVSGAAAGDEYKYAIRRGEEEFTRIDPRATRVTNSVGSGIVFASDFDWQDDAFTSPPWNELVIYELHIGTFARSDPEKPGTFDDAIPRLRYLKWLGINAVEVMPVAEFAGDLSWGYNPAHPFAVEGAYGGPDAFKRFVRAAHRLGIAVILDVVYNHFGPSDLALWQFDGWSENGKGGIYFYNDGRSSTPWGDTRPDYGRNEVRCYLRDNAMFWLEEYRVDGLRYDMTLYIRSISGGDDEIPEGWSLCQWINGEIRQQYPNKITIAEDLRGNNAVTAHHEQGGANFSSQWDDAFVHPIRAVIVAADDAHRDMEAVRSALLHRFADDAFTRVVYTESHDEVANGKSRIVSEINVDDPEGIYALKRSTLGAGIVLTAAGIPMLFQGQTTMEDGWFQDTEALDWEKTRKFPGLSWLYRDLIRLRRNLDGVSRGLTGQKCEVHHASNERKLVAFHRWSEGGPNDHTLVVANFAAQAVENYDVGFPVAGRWVARFNSDWEGYRQDLENFPVFDVGAQPVGRDGLAASGTVSVGGYSLSIYTLAE